MTRPQREGFVPLREADWKFASASLREEYWELEELPPPPKIPDPNAANWAEGVKAISESFSHAFRTRSAIGKMRAFVGEKLRRGDLEAIGFKIKPTEGEGQERIPPYFFDHAVINWDKNIVENFGACFAAVEVRRPKKLDKSQVQEATKGQPALQPEEPVTEKKRGRPSTENVIVNAIEALEKQGFNFRCCDRKRAYKEIRQYLQKEHYDIGRGFSDPVLNRCLNRHLLQK